MHGERRHRATAAGVERGLVGIYPLGSGHGTVPVVYGKGGSLPRMIGFPLKPGLAERVIHIDKTTAKHGNTPVARRRYRAIHR